MWDPPWLQPPCPHFPWRGATEPIQRSMNPQRPSLSRRTLAPLFGLALCLGALAARADGEEPGSTPTGLWQRTVQGAEVLWQRSRGAAQQAWSEVHGTVPTWARTWIPGTGQGGDGTDFPRLWQDVLPKLDRALVLEERQDTLPASTWVGPDRESNRKAVDALLDEAVEILSCGAIQDQRRRIRALQAKIEDARRTIDNDRSERVSAPQESWFRTTRGEYDRAIEDKTAEIARHREALQEAQETFARELRGLGLKLSDAQVELLLSTVVGDNMVDLGVVFDNVKALTGQLEQLVQTSGEDLPSARRYYGMYVVLLKALARMHSQVEETIRTRYLPQIDAITARAQALSAETHELQRQAPDKAALLDGNLRAQALTIETAAIYRGYLAEQAKQVAQARAALERDVAAAWNTYETVRISAELVTLVRASEHLLAGLMERQVPTLRPFENQEMRLELAKLTEQLRSQNAR